MSRRRLHSGVLLWLLFAFSCVIGDSAMAQDLCGTAQKELYQEKIRLNEYLSTLQEASEHQDLRLEEVLKFKISQAKKKIQDLKIITKNCPPRESTVPAGGLSGAKSYDGSYADKSCIELKKMLFPLLISKRSLERRKKSMLSKLTDDEEAQLREVSEQLQHVRKALKNRCSTSHNSSSLPKRLRRR